MFHAVEFETNHTVSGMNAGDETRLISRRKAAALLEVSTKTLFRWERAGLLTAIKLNARVTRYYRREVEKLIADAVVACGGAR